MKISVVIPTYHRAALLLKCLQALTGQSFNESEYEIIVVSDGPDSETAEAVRDLRTTCSVALRFLSLEKKSGPAAARNRGWRSASGRLIVFTDDDCVPDKTWLTAMWNAYLCQGEKRAAFSGKTIVPIPDEPTDYEKNISQLASAEFITANCACTHAALESVGGFDEQFTMAWREDSDLQFRLLLHGIPIVKANDAVVTHPVRTVPWGVSIKDEKKGIFNALLYKKFPMLYKQRIQPAPPWHYYGIIISLAIMVIGIILDEKAVALLALVGWIALTGWFIMKRLSQTKRSPAHVIEMIATSFVIPWLSLYWRFYGAWKFRTMLIP